MPPVIQVDSLSKRYRIGLKEKRADTFAGQLLNVLKAPIDNFRQLRSLSKFKDDDESVFWALKDINFEVQEGEVLGIIGHNGAGKSTLLKILSRITEPTTGEVRMRGRVSALLEVGTGFHPELTGRENVYMNGTILGMTRKEIDLKFDEIVDFSGVEKYIDTPVKFYSSGMKVRLGFAVAAHLEPEILIIDEVLAVGDAEFQKKCIGKMKDVSGQGRTILFVSHNMDAVLRLCKDVLLIKHGTKVIHDSCDKVVEFYLNSELVITSSKKWEDLKDAPGNDAVRLVGAKVIDANRLTKSNFRIDEKIGIEMEFWVNKESNNYICGLNVFNNKDVHIFSSHDTLNKRHSYSKGVYRAICWFPVNFFAEGMHHCSLAILSYTPFYVHFHEMQVIGFNIVDSIIGDSARGEYGGIFPGIIRPKLEWNKIEKITH